MKSKRIKCNFRDCRGQFREHICKHDDTLNKWVEVCTICGTVELHDNELSKNKQSYDDVTLKRQKVII